MLLAGADHSVVMVYDTSPQTDVEYMEQYMTYKNPGQGNYTKVFNPAHYSGDLPESVDWRTNNAVTDIKDQVYMCE